MLAQIPPWLGEITPPIGGKSYEQGLVDFINNAFKLIFIGFGLYSILNFVLASYYFLNAQGETKNVEKARKMITQSIIGLALLASVFVFAGVIGQVFFKDWDYLLDIVPTIQTIQ
jgi:flagellar biosynthesis protein FlhB